MDGVVLAPQAKSRKNMSGESPLDSSELREDKCLIVHDDDDDGGENPAMHMPPGNPNPNNREEFYSCGLERFRRNP